MRRLGGVILLVLIAGGCTSVKMVQRDGCWVRRTEKVFGRVQEEVGPCARAQPQWAQDRLTRLVQECMADADYRWHARALETWSRRLPYPAAQPRQEDLLTACMQEARTGMKAETDVEALRAKLAEVSTDRDALRGEVERDRARLEETHVKFAERLDQAHGKYADTLAGSHAKLADWLGQAAQKPAGNATATATSSSNSDGKATTESGSTLAAESGSSAPAPGTPAATASIVVPAMPAGGATATADPAPPARPKAVRARRAALVKPAPAGACEPPAGGLPPCAAAGSAEGSKP